MGITDEIVNDVSIDGAAPPVFDPSLIVKSVPFSDGGSMILTINDGGVRAWPVLDLGGDHLAILRRVRIRHQSRLWGEPSLANQGRSMGDVSAGPPTAMRSVMLS